MSPNNPISKQWRSIAVSLSTLMLSACAIESGEAESESVAQVEHEIINGTVVSQNKNAVAIYHRGSGTCNPQSGDAYSTPYSYTNEWWPRPCSGVVIRKDLGVHYILTARHCVTTNGEINGPLISNSSHLKVTSALSPGVLATVEWNGGIDVIGTPPSNAVNATVYASGSPSSASDLGEDLAIIRAIVGPFGIGDLSPTHPATRHAIFASSEGSGALNAYYVATRSYGRAVAGSCYGHNASGAGVLRSASSFYVTDSFTKYFEHTNPNASGAKIVGGDSGGMLFLADNSHANGNWRIAGVHSTATDAAGSVRLFSWIQSHMPGMYLSTRANYATDYVVGAVPIAGMPVMVNVDDDSSVTRLEYDSQKRLRFHSGLCMQAPTGTGAVTVATCSTSNRQKWNNLGAAGNIKNVSSGLCMRQASSGNNVTMASCGTNVAFKWNYFADNSPI